jgi:hypothetical protein
MVSSRFLHCWSLAFYISETTGSIRNLPIARGMDDGKITHCSDNPPGPQYFKRSAMMMSKLIIAVKSAVYLSRRYGETGSDRCDGR